MRNSTNTLVGVVFLSLLCVVAAKAQIAKDECKFLGNVIAENVPADFKTYWNQVTPENGGKWGTVEGTRDSPNWTQLDLAYSYAQTNNFPFKQHTFVWGQQQPVWMNSSLTLEEQKAEVEEWIQTYCERYPNTNYIDVVNEPLHAIPSYAQALGGSGTTGWDWVIWAFEKAREYCPNAKLLLNDYNIINNDAATTNYLQIINLLKARNLIDGIGEQGHFWETTPIATLTANLNRLHETGIPIYISEYDVNLSDDTEQQAKLQEQFTAIWPHPGVRGFTFWGYRQGSIWRTEAYLIKGDGKKRPALNWLISYVPTANGGSFCLPTTSAEDESEPGANVYPNPSMNGKFTIELTEPKVQARIIDLRGRVVKTKDISHQPSVEIELDKPVPGIYILQLLDKAHRSTYKKVIVE